MKRTLLSISLLMTISTSLACSSVPGYMAHGLMRVPSGATSTCGVLYKAFSKSFSGSGQWSELYFLDAAKAAQIGGKLQAALTAKGYLLATNKKLDANDGITGQQFGFINPDSRHVVLVQIGNREGLLFMTVNGK